MQLRSGEVDKALKIARELKSSKVRGRPRERREGMGWRLGRENEEGGQEGRWKGQSKGSGGWERDRERERWGNHTCHRVSASFSTIDHSSCVMPPNKSTNKSTLSNHSRLAFLKSAHVLRHASVSEAPILTPQQIELDEALLGNLAVVFREANLSSEATECFASAWDNNPTDEGIGR